MNLIVFSHKLVWHSPDSPTGYATDGGFAFHMAAISQIFEHTTIVVPVSDVRKEQGEVLIGGHNITIYPVKHVKIRGIRRRLVFPFWIARYFFTFSKLIDKADAVHIPVPSDVGVIGMVIANMKKKPMFSRYCGNWLKIETKAEQFIKWFYEKYAGGRNVMFTTGIESEPPSLKNPNIKWIFSSSLTNEELTDLKKVRPIFDPKSPRFIIVARQEEEKGTREVIKAINLIKEEVPGLHLDVVGDGNALQSFKDEVANLGLGDKVTFHGKVNHEAVLQLLQQANIFCYPTRSSEGFPKVVHEAMASGLPVLGTPVSAIKALLSTGAGIILKDNTPETLAEAITYVISHPDEYLRMQQSAILKADEYSLDNWRDEIKRNIKAAWNWK